MRLRHTDHAGPGPAVVLLHAFPLDSGMFERLVPLLAGAVRVVTIDLPGLGGSHVPAEEPSMAAVADGVLAVLDGLDVDRAAVLGISTGGYVALELAERAPERLDAVILGSTTPHLGEPDVPDVRQAVADEVERLHSTQPVVDSADEGLGETAHREQPRLVSALRRTILDADPDGVAWMARAIAERSDRTGALVAFPRPVVLLFGSEDTATRPESGQEMLAHRHDRPTTLTVLDGVGHLAPLEAPQQVAEVVRGLLSPLG